jgi:hypothetical protein
MGLLDMLGRAVSGGAIMGTDLGSRLYHKATGTPTADDMRNQQYAINDQIKAYKDQTALTQKEIDTARSQQDVEKRRINEKQIRALRNDFRPVGGFLNNQQAPLGNSTGLPNKLGS